MVYQASRAIASAVVVGAMSVHAAGCATTGPSCALAHDCSSGLSCHLGRCVQRLDTAAVRDRRIVLRPSAIYFGTDDPIEDGTLTVDRHAALYLTFPDLPRGTIDAAYLVVPLRDANDAPPGITALSIAAIAEPWTTRDAPRVGAPRTLTPFETLRVRPLAGSFRLDVTAFLRRSQAESPATGRARSSFGLAVRAEHAVLPATVEAGPHGAELPSLDLYVR